MKYSLIMWYLAVLLLVLVQVSRGGQMVPDAKRQAEIRKALVDHGYAPGKNWSETREILKQIARQHHWQTSHSPDARVLILLGLGNPHSDPEVLKSPPTQLEPGLRAYYELWKSKQ